MLPFAEDSPGTGQESSGESSSDEDDSPEHTQHTGDQVSGYSKAKYITTSGLY